MSNARAIREQLDRESVREWQERATVDAIGSDGRWFTHTPFATGERLERAIVNALADVRQVGRPAYVSVS